MVPTRDILMVNLAVFMDAFGYSFSVPIIPFFSKMLGGSSTEVGLTLTSYALFQTISVVFMGTLSDRFGRKLLLLISLFGSFTGPLFQSFSWSMWAFIVFRGYTGLLGGSQTIGQAYIGDVTTLEERPKYMTQQAAFISGAYIFGPGIGGLLGEWILESPFWLASLMAFIVFIIGFSAIKETNQFVIKKTELRKERKVIIKKKTNSDNDKNRINEIDKEISLVNESQKQTKKHEKVHWNIRMILMVLSRFFTESMNHSFMSMLGLYMNEKFNSSTLIVSGASCVGGFATCFAQLFVVVPLLKVLSMSQIMISGALFMIAGGIYVLFSGSVLDCYLSSILLYFGFGLVFSLTTSVLSAEAPKHAQGEVLSVGVMAGQIPMIIVPTLCGSLYQLSPFYCFLLCPIIGMLLLIDLVVYNCIVANDKKKHILRNRDTTNIDETKTHQKEDSKIENINTDIEINSISHSLPSSNSVHSDIPNNNNSITPQITPSPVLSIPETQITQTIQ
ncbi:hypothetical protein WA158_007706 [Blastocystis sp. Blastoise]